MLPLGLCFISGCVILGHAIVTAAKIISNRLATIKIISNITTTTKRVNEE